MFQFKCPIMFSKPVAQLRIPAPLALFASHFCLTMQTQKYSWTSPHKPITEHSLLHPCGPFLHSAASCTSSSVTLTFQPPHSIVRLFGTSLPQLTQVPLSTQHPALFGNRFVLFDNSLAPLLGRYLFIFLFFGFLLIPGLLMSMI